MRDCTTVALSVDAFSDCFRTAFWRSAMLIASSKVMVSPVGGRVVAVVPWAAALDAPSADACCNGPRATIRTQMVELS